MINRNWSVEEYKELVEFTKDNYNKMTWKSLLEKMAMRFQRTPFSIKTALVSMNQVNLGIDSSDNKGDKKGYSFGLNLKNAFLEVKSVSDISTTKWTYILL